MQGIYLTTIFGRPLEVLDANFTPVLVGQW